MQELGINLGAATRLQVNVMVRKASMITSYLEPFQDEIILPILWFETVSTAWANVLDHNEGVSSRSGL